MNGILKHQPVYLATPYSKYKGGDLEAAFRDAAAIAGELLRRGVSIYSPIAHTHPIAVYGGIDPADHDIWLPFDMAMMRACEALLVAQMDGWENSYGMAYEIDVFRAAGKPIYYLDPETMSVSQQPHCVDDDVIKSVGVVKAEAVHE